MAGIGSLPPSDSATRAPTPAFWHSATASGSQIAEEDDVAQALARGSRQHARWCPSCRRRRSCRSGRAAPPAASVRPGRAGAPWRGRRSARAARGAKMNSPRAPRRHPSSSCTIARASAGSLSVDDHGGQAAPSMSACGKPTNRLAASARPLSSHARHIACSSRLGRRRVPCASHAAASARGPRRWSAGPRPAARGAARGRRAPRSRPGRYADRSGSRRSRRPACAKAS